MLIASPAREAPAPSLSQRPPAAQLDPSRPPVPAEPVLAMDNIQGNSWVGLNKDYQPLLFLRIVNVPLFKRWLRWVAPFVPTAWGVLAFNRLFKAIRSRRGASLTIEATWINIAFSYHALTLLAD